MLLSRVLPRGQRQSEKSVSQALLASRLVMVTRAEEEWMEQAQHRGSGAARRAHQVCGARASALRRGALVCALRLPARASLIVPTEPAERVPCGRW